MSNTATDKQIAYLVSLWKQIITAETGLGNEAFAANLTDKAQALLEGNEVLSKRDASAKIDAAKVRIAQLPRVAAKVSVTEGLYIKDGDIYKVVLSQRGNLYAKKLVPGGSRGRFEYAPNAISLLTADDALTPERAAEWGRQPRVGHDGEIRVYCACCGAELDTAESRERGIGPVCFRRVWGA